MVQFTDNAMTVLEARYLRKNDTGAVTETPDELLERVALALAECEKDREEFLAVMERLDFLPNTPTLINAGRQNGQLSACFVLPIEDSMEGIFTAVKNAAIIHKTGGGTGFSFSRLRSKGARVSTTGGEASGVVSFLRVFNTATDSVKQGGVRRGANMGILNINHPDIEEFIMCKDDTSQLTNFNLSVGVSDEFMLAVTSDRQDLPLIDPHTRKVVKTIPARRLWQMIIHQAWKNGEPGIVFLDVINRANPTPEYGAIEATNPCGEQPLLPYESCNLGSINLSNHVKDGVIDYDHLRDTVHTAVRFLNAVLNHNCFPLPEIKENTLRTRKIGLGVMGFADMLIKLKIPYASPTAAKMAELVMSFINKVAHDYSELKHFENATCTTIAPTGTISMLANTSSGIEPNFSWVYTRNSCDKVLYVVHPLMEELLRSRGLYNEETLKLLHKGTPLQDIPGLEQEGKHWQLSHEIKPEEHIRIQAAFQKHTDNAVSKTINLPSSATEADVESAYKLAYSSGCKGVTVYRDGSRDSQVLNFDNKTSATENAEIFTIRKRPLIVDGTTQKTTIGCGTLYITVNKGTDGEPIEVFINAGKAGGLAQSEGLSRMISLALRHNVPVAAICKQLCGIRCMSTIRKKECDVLSCPDAIGSALRAKIGASTGVQSQGGCTCPECGEPLEQAEGCVICHSCGYSKCN